MKIIKDIKQGTQEWQQLRLGKITASNFDKVITRSGEYASKASDTLAFELASAIFLEYEDESYKSADMEKGNDFESIARQEYESLNLVNVEQITFIDCGNYGCSPDGFVGEDGAIEIKCPKAKTHFKYIKENKIPNEYYAQCQGVLMCSERKWLDFISYHPGVKKEHRFFIKRIERDEEFIENLKFYINLTIKKINSYLQLNNTNFNQNTESFEIEEIEDKDINLNIGNEITIKDQVFEQNLQRYIELEDVAEEFNKLKKTITSQAEVVHLANNVVRINCKNYAIDISYSIPKIHTEKTIAKKITSATEDLENAINLLTGQPQGEPKFKCKIIKKLDGE